LLADMRNRGSGPILNNNSEAHDCKRVPFNLSRLPSIWSLDMRTSWLVEGLVPEGALTLITGDSGVGKSTLALALAGAVAHGVPFLDLRTMQRTALYVDGENPGSVVRERLERLGIKETRALQVWGGWNEVAPLGPHFSGVIEWAKEHRGLIVYDSLIQFHSGSEQDSSETRQYMLHFRTLAHLGASVLILHHTGKGENARQYRGSSDIKAAVDQALVLEALGESESGNHTLRLKPFKNRIAEVPTLRIDFSGGVFRVASGAPRTNREMLLDVIERNPNLPGREINALAGAAGVAKNRCEALLVEGARDGWLIVTPGPHRSKLYRLRDADD
jgi:hypothetical protein